jgi:hypothetical protein
MSVITIHTLWGARHGESMPELMAAWDEYSVDQNYEGWREDCERAIKSWGDDLQEKRYLDIDVSEQEVIAAFGDVR